MSKPIAVDDLVMTVKSMLCCGASTGSEGIPFVVQNIVVCDFAARCMTCGHLFPAGGLGAFGAASKRPIRLERLIRIDPPAIDTTTETELELTV